MAKRRAYPLRMDGEILAALQRYADDELRSLNAQIEFICRDALRKAGRLPVPDDPGASGGDRGSEPSRDA
ncbi:MAG: Arc family DNA binding domain-containing protein [Pseudomonadota bacterium]